MPFTEGKVCIKHGDKDTGKEVLPQSSPLSASSFSPPSILTWDPEQEEPPELSRKPHVQKCELRSPSKSEQDQSWAFISNLQGKVLLGEQHANPLVGAAMCTEPRRRGDSSEQRKKKGFCVEERSSTSLQMKFMLFKGKMHTVNCVLPFSLPVL